LLPVIFTDDPKFGDGGSYRYIRLPFLYTEDCLVLGTNPVRYHHPFTPHTIVDAHLTGDGFLVGAQTLEAFNDFSCTSYPALPIVRDMEPIKIGLSALLNRHSCVYWCVSG
jgi:hypothetical protein